MMEKLSNREIRKRLQDIFKKYIIIGTVSATDSSVGREISDRTDLFDGRGERTDQEKKNIILIKEKHILKGKQFFQFHILYAGYEKGKDVLSNLSVEVKEGEIFAAVGANGSGKSTLLSCMAKQMKLMGN